MCCGTWAGWYKSALCGGSPGLSPLNFRFLQYCCHLKACAADCGYFSFIHTFIVFEVLMRDAWISSVSSIYSSDAVTNTTNHATWASATWYNNFIQRPCRTLALGHWLEEWWGAGLATVRTWVQILVGAPSCCECGRLTHSSIWVALWDKALIPTQS